MKPKEIYIQLPDVGAAVRIIDATEQPPKKQTWICSNCGLKRTFHRVSRVHNCQLTKNFALTWCGIWRRRPANNYPRISVIPPDSLGWTDYLIGFRVGVLIISIKSPEPFSAYYFKPFTE